MAFIKIQSFKEKRGGNYIMSKIKIFKFKIEGNKLYGGWEVEDDSREIKGYCYGYGKNFFEAKKDAEDGLLFEAFLKGEDIEKFDFDAEEDAKEEWYKQIWK